MTDVTTEQLSLVPAEQCHLRLDLYIVGPADRLAMTCRLTEGTSAELISLHTAGFTLDNAGLVQATAHMAENLRTAIGRLSPF